MGSPLVSDFSNRELLEQIASQVGAVYSGSAGVRHTSDHPSGVDIDQTARFSVTLTDASGSSLPSADIAVGTYNIKRTRAATTTTLVSGGTPSKADGIVYIDYTVADADWNVDDIVWVEFVGIQDTDSGLTFPTVHQFALVTNLQLYQTTIQNTYNTVTDGAHGNAALLSEIQGVEAKVDTVDANVDQLLVDVAAVDAVVDSTKLDTTQLISDVAAVDAVADAIKAKTDLIPAAPAAVSDCITQAGVRTAVGLASANLDTQLTTIDAVADAILAGSHPIRSANLRAFWPLSRDARDLIGGNNLTATGAAASHGFEGKAYNFVAASSQRLNSTGTNLASLIPSAISFSAWVYPIATVSAGIVGFRNGAGVPLFCMYLASGVPGLYAYDSSNKLYNPGSALPLNTWSFITITYNGSTGAITPYVNGVATGTGTITGTFNTATHTNIGSNGTANYFDGRICNVGIWDGVLSADDVASLYRMGRNMSRLLLPELTSMIQGSGLVTPIDASNVPVANTLQDILHKNGSYTFDNTTDSLEAIADAIASIGAASAYTVARSSDNFTSGGASIQTITKDAGSGLLLEILDISIHGFDSAGDETFNISLEVESDRNATTYDTITEANFGPDAGAGNRVDGNVFSLNHDYTPAGLYKAIRLPIYTRVIRITLNQVDGAAGVSNVVTLMKYRTIPSYTSENL